MENPREKPRSKAKTQNAAFEDQGVEGAATTTTWLWCLPQSVMVAAMAMAVRPFSDSLVFFCDFSVFTQFCPFCVVILSFNTGFRCKWMIHIHYHLTILKKTSLETSLRDWEEKKQDQVESNDLEAYRKIFTPAFE